MQNRRTLFTASDVRLHLLNGGYVFALCIEELLIGRFACV
jgi:hypothetical protein